MKIVKTENGLDKRALFYLENCKPNEVELYDLISHNGFVWEVRGIEYEGRGVEAEVTRLEVEKANARRFAG